MINGDIVCKMLRFSGNTVSAIASPISLFLVQESGTYQLLDVSNTVYTNAALLTLVQADIVSGTALGSSKRYTVNGVAFVIDFTRLW